jgi:hypothetical protein
MYSRKARGVEIEAKAWILERLRVAEIEAEAWILVAVKLRVVSV